MVGEPGSERWLEITAQLNFPARKYNRRFAGAFVRDSTGDVLVAHRGKLTKGNAGLKKVGVFREFSPRLIEAEDAGQSSTLILIASLDDAALAERLCEFAKEAREVARKLGGDRLAPPTADNAIEDPDRGSRTRSGRKGTNDTKHPLTTSARSLKLRKYFDEHSGTTDVQTNEGGKRTVEHGDIVKALENLVAKRGDTQKARAIDLVVITKLRADLFEVKTSARTTDVYTGVGQLLIHGESIAELLKLPVNRYLVLPERLNSEHERHIVKKGHMRIVTYRKNSTGYQFEGV